MSVMKGVTKAFQNLSTEARELCLTCEVPVLSSPPSPLQFYREWVSPNIPVIIQNNFSHWPALKLWSSEYFRTKIGHLDVTVAVTPNGYADAVVDDYFVMPEERTMKMSNFLDILDGKIDEKGIFYIQKQNSNFTDEFSEIIQDAAVHIPWASEAFGKLPDAVNLWMGDGRAVTSMHKDHYENLYCVVSGSKTFTLIPPTDLPYVTHGLYKPGKYQSNENGEFKIVEELSDGNSDSDANRPTFDDKAFDNSCEDDVDGNDGRHTFDDKTFDNTCGSDADCSSHKFNNDTDGLKCNDDNSKNSNVKNPNDVKVPWVSVDPLNPDFKLYPDYAKAHPITCTIQAGDTLYLPSLWFHHVQQSHKCIAVNFWYDMEFDIKYCYYNFLESLSKLVKE